MSVPSKEKIAGKEPVKLAAADVYHRCMASDEEAWRYLYSWCVKQARMKNMQEAEDVAQQVCLKLLDGGIEKVREPSSFLAFVRTAVNNQFIDQYRKTARLDSLDKPPAGAGSTDDSVGSRMPALQASPDMQAEARLLLCRLEELITKLPDYCNMVMQAYIKYRLGLLEGYKDMAENLDIPMGTLSVRIKRCLAELRRFPEFNDLDG